MGCNRGCDTVAKDRQDLYLHSDSFSGVMDEANIRPLQEHLSKAKTFRFYQVDCYEEYQDLSDEARRAELEAKWDEITDYILKKCRTKRRDLYKEKRMKHDHSQPVGGESSAVSCLRLFTLVVMLALSFEGTFVKGILPKDEIPR